MQLRINANFDGAAWYVPLPAVMSINSLHKELVVVVVGITHCMNSWLWWL